MQWGESPGSIRNQIGRSLNAMRERVELGDVGGAADHLAFLLAISAPKLKPEEREKLVIPEPPGGQDKTGKLENEYFRRLMTILADLLCILSKRGLYSWTEAEVGDARGLALTDDGEGGAEGGEEKGVGEA